MRRRLPGADNRGMLRHAAVAALCLLVACASPVEVFSAPDPTLPFSSAVRVGDTLHVAGHLGVDGDGRVPADPADEVRLLLDRFAATMARAGMTMDDLVAVQVYCSDVSLYGVFNDLYRERFEGVFPSRAFIGSGPLLRGARFEMLGTAVRR